MNIFIVEDDKSLAEHIKHYLAGYHYDVHICSDFENVVGEFIAAASELILLDVNLPYFDGFYWCRELRKQTNAPIIFLSARDQTMDQVFAIENGADDYLTKPFSYDLLLAKIKSYLRRAYGDYKNIQAERVVTYDSLSYYPEQLLLTNTTFSVQLSKKEGDLMELLLTRAPNICQRDEILFTLWDDEQFVDDNTLSVNITRVRKKLADLHFAGKIITVRNVGYQLSAEASL